MPRNNTANGAKVNLIINQKVNKMTKILKTSFQLEREKKELALYREYVELTNVAGNSRMVVNEHLLKKYGLHSHTTIYRIVARVSERLKGGNNED